MLNSTQPLVKPSPTTAPPISIDGIEQRSKVPWRDVALFTGLAYAFAWVLWIALRPNLFHFLTASRTPSNLAVPAIYVLGMFAPAAAAVVMRLFISKEGLKGSLGPVRAWRFYALAVLLAAVVVSLVIGVDGLTGLGTFTWNGKPSLWVEYAGLAFDGLTFSAVMALGEEYGWRGYLLPKLLPLGEFKAAVMVGAIWALWHTPIIIAGLNYPGVAPLAAIAVFIPVTIAMSVLFARVFVAAGGAVLVTAVLHGSFNAFGDRLTSTSHLTGSPLVVTPAGAVGIGVILIIAAVLYALSKPGRMQRRRVTAQVAAGGHGIA
jgi:CAAX protease family protein